ncbi:MAG: heavy metal translocating P-type ATPase [Lentisphaerae bacterium]|nr:heavy metal translocating P-type ATPase [Lentisphaerota bacterium]
MITDPVCKMTFPPEKAAATFVYNNTTYYFCNIKCKEKFAAEPELYLSGNAPAESCCCCSEAFEDDDEKIRKRLKKLFFSFCFASCSAVVIALLNHEKFFSVQVNNYVQFALATLTVSGAGGFLLVRGVKSLKNFKLNMFTLISLGIASAYFYSVYALFFVHTLPEALLDAQGMAKLHFQAAAMITALVILGQFLEGKASRGAGQAIRSLMEQLPAIAHRVKKCCGTVSDVKLQEVVPGDHLKILPHERIPVDGVVIEGSGSVDESMLTGEAVLIEKTIGSPLAAGTLNGNTILLMRAEKVGSDTLLSQITGLVKSARNAKLPVHKLADKVSAIFVPSVLAVALLSLMYWGLIAKDWSMALSNFISVLLAACPCSLGLAAPLAVTVGTGCAAGQGILIKNPSALENLRKIDTLMLDKTGTLTENKLIVSKVYTADDTDRELFLKTLFALEQNSNHPLAGTVCSMNEFALYSNDLPEVEDFSSIAGKGISGIVNDIKFVLGNVEYLQSEFIDTESFLKKYELDIGKTDNSLLLLGTMGKVWGAVAVSDVLRPDAGKAVAGLKNNGLDLVIVSGDNAPAVKHCAYTLGIEEYYAKLTPQDKLQKVRNRQQFGRGVVMVGDGVNDAAALAAADVSIAMGSGSAPALANADITLLEGSIGKLCKLFAVSNAVNETIRQNLYLAFAYNITLIPLAAGVFYNVLNWQFSPVLSSIAMSGSCLLVVFNSLKLKYLFAKKAVC